MLLQMPSFLMTVLYSVHETSCCKILSADCHVQVILDWPRRVVILPFLQPVTDSLRSIVTKSLCSLLTVCFTTRHEAQALVLKGATLARAADGFLSVTELIYVNCQTECCTFLKNWDCDCLFFFVFWREVKIFRFSCVCINQSLTFFLLL